MKRKLLLTSSLIGVLVLWSLAYGINKNSRDINGVTYEIDGNKLMQKTEDEDKTVSFGVIADPHGYYENVEAFSNHFKDLGLDGIIMLGDYAQRKTERKRDPNLSMHDEIMFCLGAAAKQGLPVFVIPGNHDMKKDFEKALDELSKKYSNIFDLSKIRIIDGDDFDFVSNPYGTDFTYKEGSFKGTVEQIREIVEFAKQLKQDDDPEILLTHQPPKGVGEYSVDFTRNKENVGDETLDKIMFEEGLIPFSLSGHIHEASGGVTSEGGYVPPDTFSGDLRFNPGSACPWTILNGKKHKGMAGILIVNGDQAKYQTLTLE